MAIWDRVSSLLWTPATADAEDVEWVQQVEQNSCAVACLAMVLGVDYWEARARVPVFNPEQGMVMSQALRVLGENGWAYQEKWPDYSPAGSRRQRWPIRPWAPLHLASVEPVGDGGYHAVVMLSDGTVRDPLAAAPMTLNDYAVVHQIVGLWRVT